MVGFLRKDGVALSVEEFDENIGAVSFAFGVSGEVESAGAIFGEGGLDGVVGEINVRI